MRINFSVWCGYSQDLFFSFMWISIKKHFDFSPVNFTFVFAVSKLTFLCGWFFVCPCNCCRILSVSSSKWPVFFCLGPLLPVFGVQSQLSDWVYSDSVHRVVLSGTGRQTMLWWGLSHRPIACQSLLQSFTLPLWSRLFFAVLEFCNFLY